MASQQPEHGTTAEPLAGAWPTNRRVRLGELLVRAGVIDEEHLAVALSEKAPRERLGTTVVRLGLASEEDVADAVATQLRLPRIDLLEERPDPEAVERVPARLAARHGVLPMRIDGDVLVLATAEPSNIAALDDVRMAAKVRTVRSVVATPSVLDQARRRVYSQDATQDLIDEFDDSSSADFDDELEVTETSQPVVRLVDSLLADAVNARASDIHLEPERDGLRVRLRIDGMLRERARVPRSMAAQVISRIKIQSRLDIAERRLPQDGRAMVRVEGMEVDLRVSTMPTLYGETVVIRLLPKGADRVEVNDLGLPSDVLERLLFAMDRPQGMVLVTGPTGSGKTTTLYAALEAVTRPTRNVLTLEDPVEYQLPGVNQTQVNPKIGLTFARGLRHVLRQDPDVVLVGEIRDAETAHLAVEASITGHLVLATLHTNDAASAIARLVDLGVDRFLVASSLLLVLAQRLARRNCERCSVAQVPDPQVLRRLGLEAGALPADARPSAGPGCRACEGSGVSGRLSLGEALSVSPEVRELILDGASESAIARRGRLEGMVTMREDAILRASAGIITFEEALRTTPEPSGDVARCPNCATAVADDHLVCPQCAHPLGTAHCSGCGRAVESAWTTCPWCRRTLTSASSAEQDAPDTAAGPETSVAAAAPQPID